VAYEFPAERMCESMMLILVVDHNLTQHSLADVGGVVRTYERSMSMLQKVQCLNIDEVKKPRKEVMGVKCQFVALWIHISCDGYRCAVSRSGND
jgi:predicted trehalose synthase